MKKFMIAILLSAVWLGASEFVSLTHGKLLDKLIEQGADAGSYLSFTDKFQMTHSAGLGDGSVDYTVPNGWQRFKIYIPGGVKSGGVVMTPSTNISFRYYFHFKADRNNIIDNSVTDLYYMTPDAFNKQQTLMGKGTPTSSVSLDEFVDAINAAGGGWIYFNILEDNYNLGSNYPNSVVHPDLSVSWSFILKDDADINKWVNSTVFIEGDPEDATDLIESINPDGKTETLTMDRGVTHYDSLENYANGTSTTVRSSESNTGSGGSQNVIQMLLLL